MRKQVSATAAKNRFGQILKMAESEPVYIVKHGKPRTVVVDAARYEALAKKGRDPADKAIEALRKEFDAMYARMQTPQAAKAIDRLLTMSAEEMNRIAARRIRRARAKASR